MYKNKKKMEIRFKTEYNHQLTLWTPCDRKNNVPDFSAQTEYLDRDKTPYELVIGFDENENKVYAVFCNYEQLTGIELMCRGYNVAVE